MANGPLRTFFRQDAGYPEDEPDLTDYLLDSMIQRGGQPRTTSMGGSMIPLPTSASRVSSMGGMRGYPGMQGAPGPQNPTRPPMGGRDPWGMPMPAPQQDVNVTARAYPGMPGPPPAAQPMPQMAKPTWIDYLSQAGGALADGLNARSGIRSNFFGQIGGQQQMLRDREFQAAMAERSAMENAARLAHEYDWRKYGAGRQEARFDQQTADKAAERKLYESLIKKQQDDAERQGMFQKYMYEQGAQAKFKDAGGLGDLEEAEKAALLQARSPEELEAIRRMAAQARAPLEAQRQQAAAAAALEAEIDAEVKRMVMERMSRPGYGDSYGFGGLGLAAQFRPEAERIVKQRRGMLK
jgi:hypothetical protein